MLPLEGLWLEIALVFGRQWELCWLMLMLVGVDVERVQLSVESVEV